MRIPPDPPAPALFLFDIDGTLLRRAGPHHRWALEQAVWRVAGLRATTNGFPVQGMLDRDILSAMLRAAGATRRVENERMAAIAREAQRIYRSACPGLRARVCPGVRRLLRTLLRLGIPAGLVTGNLSRIAWRKMEQAALRGYFQLGAFADQGRTRAGRGAAAWMDRAESAHRPDRRSSQRHRSGARERLLQRRCGHRSRSAGGVAGTLARPAT